MKKLLFALCLFFALNAYCEVNVSNYLYDHDGNPSFVKVYLNEWDESNIGKNEGFLAVNKVVRARFHLLLQKDGKGSYMAIPLQKKGKDKDKDKDEDDYWICPHCGRKNKETDNYCRTWGCPFAGGILKHSECSSG